MDAAVVPAVIDRWAWIFLPAQINIPFLGVGFICLSLQESIVRCYYLYAILFPKVTFNFRDIKMFPFKFYYPRELKNTVDLQVEVYNAWSSTQLAVDNKIFRDPVQFDLTASVNLSV